MVDYAIGYGTDVGIKKKVNQDSLCIKKAFVGDKLMVLAIVCDGMGGLSKGELASATVVRRFSDWFVNEMSLTCESIEEIRMQWERIIQKSNDKLWNYGIQNGVQLGTTLTAVLVIGNEDYLIAQVGDSRAYLLKREIVQLTEDQSFVAREVKRGNMTKEEAAVDPRRNVLLQCIGASKTVEPAFVKGKIEDGSGFLLCSDGFRHKVTEDEFLTYLGKTEVCEKQSIQSKIRELIELNKQRGETDNITAIFMKQLQG